LAPTWHPFRVPSNSLAIRPTIIQTNNQIAWRLDWLRTMVVFRA